LLSSNPFVSVILPVLNREASIGKCLRSLQEVDYDSFEILVIDGGSTDGTREIASRYNVRLISQRRAGPYAAMNEGIEQAHGEILAFTHSDCTVQKDWLTKLVACYSNGVGGVGGRVLSQDSDSMVGKFLSLSPQQNYDSSSRVELGTPNKHRFGTIGLSSGNMSFRRCVLREVGGFAEDVVKLGGHYISWKIQRAGYVLVYEPHAVVRHEPRSTLTEFIRVFYRVGMGQPMLLKKQPDKYSYVEVKTYLLPARGVRCRLPIRALVTFDLFNLATFALVVAILYPPSLFLFGISFLIISPLVLKRMKEASDRFRSTRLLLLFPFLHVVRSFSFMLGRIVGGVQSRILAL